MSAADIFQEDHMRILRAAAIGLVLVSATAVQATWVKQKSLYERLGKRAAITAVVDDFVGNVAADKRINRFFAKTDIDRLKLRLVEQICAGTGGPCTYRGGTMKAVHKGLGISDGDFNALVQDLGKSLNKFKVPAREQKELVAILAPMRKDIVERSSMGY
jgi:hemoglobin